MVLERRVKMSQIKLFKMYVDLSDLQDFSCPSGRRKDCTVSFELSEILTEKGIISGDELECRIFSFGKVSKVKKLTDEDMNLIKATKSITGYPLEEVRQTRTVHVLRLYCEELKCFFDYDIRKIIRGDGYGRALSPAGLTESRTNRLSYKYIGKPITLKLKLDHNISGGIPVYLLKMPDGTRFEIPNDIPTGIKIKELQIKAFEEDLVNQGNSHRLR